MKPYLLQGHSRPLTQVKYNKEGDLVVSCAKDLQPCLWFAENGQRIGTFVGHNGAIWSCDINQESTRLITASADSSVRIWNMNGGEELFKVALNEPCRAISYALGERMASLTTDTFMGIPPRIHLLTMAEDIEDQTAEPLLTIEAPKGRITRTAFTDFNQTLVTSHDGGWLRRWDTETGTLIQEEQVHDDAIQDMQLSPCGSYVITASLDKTARLVDVHTLQVLKTYKTGRFVQSAVVSPLFDHVLLGGGQDASQVTTTAAKAGGFEARFYHRIYQEEFGNVRGHFGPINTVAFSPDGRGFCTGGEDGYVRLHHFDMDYFTTKFF